MKFIITETNIPNDIREGEVMEAVSLSTAKRYASKNQCFHGTWLTIENELGVPLCRKNPDNGKWEDFE